MHHLILIEGNIGRILIIWRQHMLFVMKMNFSQRTISLLLSLNRSGKLSAVYLHTWHPSRKTTMKFKTLVGELILQRGLSIIYNYSDSINLQIIRNNRILWTLDLEDVLVEPNLDRRLFSVNSFLNKVNNLALFKKNYIDLGIYEGPGIEVLLSSL